MQVKEDHIQQQKRIDLQKHKEKMYRILVIQRENAAAVVIQTAFRKFSAKKRYKVYEEQYKRTQERILAAMKIQMFYRSVQQSKKAQAKVKELKNKKIVLKKKTHMINFFTDYVIRYKFLKPRLFSLLKQLDKILKHRRENMVVSAAIFIQYKVRKWLKKLAASRVVKPKIKKRQKVNRWRKPEWQSPPTNFGVSLLCIVSLD